VIASEELGKAFAIAEIVWQAEVGRSAPKGLLQPEDHQLVRELLSNHKLKQGWFVRTFFDIFGLIDIHGAKGVFRRYQTIQGAKNDAIYAGVRRGNYQVVRPFRMSASKARRQIRTVNKALLDAVEGTLDGSMYFEEAADQIFRSRRLLNKLQSAAKTVR
jgi:hypothetical protein